MRGRSRWTITCAVPHPSRNGSQQSCRSRRMRVSLSCLFATCKRNCHRDRISLWMLLSLMQRMWMPSLRSRRWRKQTVCFQGESKGECLVCIRRKMTRGWKAIGRQVKKGEKCIATFMIWKHTTKKKKSESEDEDEQEKMFMTKAFFFRECQTEEIAK